VAATQILLIKKVSGSGARCRLGSWFRTCQRIKTFSSAWEGLWRDANRAAIAITRGTMG